MIWSHFQIIDVVVMYIRCTLCLFQETRDMAWEVAREFMDLGRYIHNKTDQEYMIKVEVRTEVTKPIIQCENWPPEKIDLTLLNLWLSLLRWLNFY